MVVERSWLLGVFACALAVPTACGGISQSTVDGEAGESSGGIGASGGNGSGAGPGAGGGGTGGVGGAGGNPPTPAGGSIQTGGSGGTSTGGKGGFSVGGSFTGGTGVGATGMGATGGTSPMGGTGGTSPMGGTGGTLPRPDPRIPWDATGFIHATDNSFGIQGTWYLATDCAGAVAVGLPCTQPDLSLIGPDMQPGWATSPEKVCMRGVAPQVVADPATGMPAYALQWGALFGFNLADGLAYNAALYGIRGFQFDITANFEARIRANVVTTTTVGVPHFVELFIPTVNQTVYFSDALQGSWVTAPVPLDTSALTSLEFHVYTNTTATTPFDICVSNMRVIL